MAKSIYRNACDSTGTISKKTVIACFDEGSRTHEWLSSLSDDQWVVTSFDPATRLVCGVVESNSGKLIYLALTLPEITAKN